jgi:hypothetical protein
MKKKIYLSPDLLSIEVKLTPLMAGSEFDNGEGGAGSKEGKELSRGGWFDDDE